MNWYVERIESVNPSSPAALYPTPGVELLSDTAAEGPGSAHFAEGGREFAVIGTSFYQVLSDGILTTLGNVARDGNPATISSSGDAGGQIFITSGGNGYIYTISNMAFAQVTALDGIATMGGHLDGYFLCLDQSTSTVNFSDYLDGTTWDPLNFFSRLIASDPWVAMKIANRYIYMLGSETSEVWYDEGSYPIPFVAHPSGLIQFGCVAPFSVEVIGSSVA